MNRKTKKLLTRLLPLLVLAVAYLVLQLLPEQKRPVTIPDGELQVHFIDVGQADCALILQGDGAMLIDAGNNNDGDLVVDYLRDLGVTSLTYAVGTHPHEDHIGGLDTVLRKIPVENLLMPRIQTDTKTFEDVLDAAMDRGLSITAPRQNDTFSVGAAVVTALQCLETDDLNNASLIFRLDYGDVSFLFTGDAEAEAEEAVLGSRVPLNCDVLKVGHHGSSTSTTEAFLLAVSPDYAVISCGVGNDYGHPHRETVNALDAAGITTFRTDRLGTVVAATDGSTINWNQTSPAQSTETYVLNTNSKYFHLPDCGSVSTMSQKNKQTYTGTRGDLLSQNYSPCPGCQP